MSFIRTPGLSLLRVMAISTLALLPILFSLSPNKAESLLSEAPSKYAKLDNLRVHYKNYGAGQDALIFVHVWGLDLTSWRGQIPAFEGKKRMLLLDLPGHGESDKPQIAYTFDLFARSIEAVMRDAGVKKAILIGHSNGTPVIRQFYRKYPEKTLALVVVDGPLKVYGTKEQLEGFIAPLRGEGYKTAAVNLLEMGLPPDFPQSLRDEIKTRMLRTPRHVMVSSLESFVDPALWKDDKITVPVLAVYAKQPTWNAEYLEYARNLVPNLELQMWDGVGHFLMMEKPQKFNEAMKAFLIKNKFLKG